MAEVKVQPRPFFGRSDILTLIRHKLDTCQDGGIIIGLEGDGGYGKSAILRECAKMAKYAMIVDFKRERDPFRRLETIAAGARVTGLKTPRFERLLEIKDWFLTGKVSGPKTTGWAKDLMGGIPPLRDLADPLLAFVSLGRALNNVVERHYSGVSKWLTEQLGKDYGRGLLQTLRGLQSGDYGKLLKLFMQALVDDIQFSEGEDEPVLLLFDEFDLCEESRVMEIAFNGVPVNESELWQLMFTRIKGSLLVVAARGLPDIAQSLGIKREVQVIEELDHDSCLRIVESAGVDDEQKRQLIVESCHRNPEAIWATMDAYRRGELSLSEIQSLRSDELTLVRKRIWDLLMNRAPSLAHVARRAALLPVFDEQILDVVCGDLGIQQWTEFVQLSFVEDSDPYWRLHDLARDIALADYGASIHRTIEQARDSLLEASGKREDPRYLGLAICVDALANERKALEWLSDTVKTMAAKRKHSDILLMLDVMAFRTDLGRAVLMHTRAESLLALNRTAEAEADLEYSQQTLRELLKSDSSVGTFLASVLRTYGELLSETVRLDKAEYFYKEALEISREMSKADPEHSLRDVALTLDDLGNLYEDTGRPEEAESNYDEALRIFRMLADTIPGEFTSDVAGTLHDIGRFYSRTNRPDKAESNYDEALRIRRELASIAPEEFLPDVAGTLNDLCILYSDTGRLERAENSINEALEILRKIPDGEADQFLDSLIKTLNNLGNLCQDTGRLEKAEVCLAEALGIARRLVGTAPERFQHGLAMTENNLADLYSKRGRPEEAEALYKEALRIWKELSEAAPEQYQPYVAIAFNNLGELYSERDRPEEAEALYKEALRIWKELSEAAPEQYQPYVAIAFNNLGDECLMTCRPNEAESNYVEALRIYVGFVKTAPDQYLPDLALIHNTLARMYSDTCRLEKAETSYSEALRIRRQLAEKAPEQFLPDVATTLNDFGVLYCRAARPEMAESKLDEALRIRRLLADKTPELFRPDVATSLNNLGILHCRTGRPEKAERSFDEALRIRRELAEKSQEQFLSDVATCLNNLGNVYSITGRLERAETNYEEALRIHRKLAETEPLQILQEVAVTLNNLGILYSDTERPDEAEKKLVEATEIYCCFAKKAPTMFRNKLMKAAENLRKFYVSRRGLSEDESKGRVMDLLAKTEPRCKDCGIL